MPVGSRQKEKSSMFFIESWGARRCSVALRIHLNLKEGLEAAAARGNLKYDALTARLNETLQPR